MNPKGNLSQPPYSSQTGRSMSRPPSRLPEGYKPGSSLPPGYLPPMRDLQKTGAILRDMDRSKLTRRQIIMLATGAAVVVLFIAALAVAFVIQGSIGTNGASSPDTTLQHYYSDLKVPNYPAAYSLLSPKAQQSRSQAAYVNNFKQIDSLNGTIVEFTIKSDIVKGNQATAVVQFSRDPSQPQFTLDTVQLEQINGTWLIDSIVSINVVPTPS
jgi:hypothetical protein